MPSGKIQTIFHLQTAVIYFYQSKMQTTSPDSNWSPSISETVYTQNKTQKMKINDKTSHTLPTECELRQTGKTGSFCHNAFLHTIYSNQLLLTMAALRSCCSNNNNNEPRQTYIYLCSDAQNKLQSYCLHYTIIFF